MMRTFWATIVAVWIVVLTTAPRPASAQNTRSATARSGVPSSTVTDQRAGAQAVAGASSQAGGARAVGQNATSHGQPQQPFPPLDAAAQQQLHQFLLAWQNHSRSTKDLDCKFTRWHFDMFAAPAGVAATRADGVIKYAAPDKGLFRVDRLLYFIGMEDGKPQYKAQAGQYGEHWVCNGTQLIEFDRSKEECRIQDLPEQMRGKGILNGPLPFVFNLDARQILQRYWVRLVQVPQPGIVLVEAWPKRQEDRAQYKLVQIALNKETFQPQALLLYSPNFDAKIAPRWDHYEFTQVKRNSIGAGFQRFLNNFIPQKPPANWKIIRERFTPPSDAPGQQSAAAPAATQTR